MTRFWGSAAGFVSLRRVLLSPHVAFGETPRVEYLLAVLYIMHPVTSSFLLFVLLGVEAGVTCVYKFYVYIYIYLCIYISICIYIYIDTHMFMCAYV